MMIMVASSAQSGWVTHIATASTVVFYCMKVSTLLLLWKLNTCLYFDRRYQKCVYTYRILPSEDKKLSVQVCEQLMQLWTFGRSIKSLKCYIWSFFYCQIFTVGPQTAVKCNLTSFLLSAVTIRRNFSIYITICDIHFSSHTLQRE